MPLSVENHPGCCHSVDTVHLPFIVSGGKRNAIRRAGLAPKAYTLSFDPHFKYRNKDRQLSELRRFSEPGTEYIRNHLTYGCFTS